MTFIYFALILGITVFIHELGHFIFAKKAGVHVYEFALGMGPQIFKFNRKNDETTYSIRLFPIGGFVQMAGEDNSDDSDIPSHKKLNNKKWYERFLTIIAGIVFNFLFAFLLLFLIGLFSGSTTITPIVTNVDKEYSSYQQGLRDGDIIIKVEDTKVHTVDQLQLELSNVWGQEFEMTVKDSNGQVKELNLKPNGEEKIGYGFMLDGKGEKGFIAAVKYSFLKTYSLLHQMIYVFAYLISGKIGTNALAGPIGIFSVVSDAAKMGFVNLVYLNAVISINVGFINLLPIPAFDGGRILFLVIEKIKGKPVKPELEATIHAIGFFILMLLMLFVTYNDIVRIFS